ncbi:MAG TPA: glycine zipper 2TM domain-containing protein [Rhodocyclaceae bacterium]|jgi:outer membrane lipoprotein SlyB|nr:glycine zipper 2TM domain-containing protein [Rhodocyclaceae bacterium]
MENNTGTPAKLHPALWVAAIAVTAFSVVGIGAVTGLLPMGGNKTTEPVHAEAPPPAPVAAPAPVATPTPPTPVVTAPVEKPVIKATNTAPRQTTTHYSSKPRRIDDDNDVYRSNSVSYPPPPPAPVATCRNCGIVESVNAVKEKGEGTGLGAVAGGVVGGVLGNQVGKGGGRDIARIVGIAGGAFAGHEIEKSERSHTTYNVTVRLDDGSTRTFRQESQPAWQAGDRVRVEDGTIIPR